MPQRKPEIDEKAAAQHASNLNDYIRWAFPDGFQLHSNNPEKPEDGFAVGHYSLRTEANRGTHASALREHPVQVTLVKPKDAHANVMLALLPHPQHPESALVLKKLAELLKPKP